MKQAGDADLIFQRVNTDGGGMSEEEFISALVRLAWAIKPCGDECKCRIGKRLSLVLRDMVIPCCAHYLATDDAFLHEWRTSQVRDVRRLRSSRALCR